VWLAGIFVGHSREISVGPWHGCGKWGWDFCGFTVNLAA
jgi:hypothetical protein